MFGGAEFAILGALFGLGTTAYSAYQRQQESKRQLKNNQDNAKKNYNLLREAAIEREMGSGLESPTARKKIDQSEQKTMSQIKGMYDTSFWGNFLGGGGLKTVGKTFSSYGDYTAALSEQSQLQSTLGQLTYGGGTSGLKKKPKIDLLNK